MVEGKGSEGMAAKASGVGKRLHLRTDSEIIYIMKELVFDPTRKSARLFFLRKKRNFFVPANTT